MNYLEKRFHIHFSYQIYGLLSRKVPVWEACL